MSDTPDLGTWHVRVVLADGRGFIAKHNTGARYTGGTQDVSPLDAQRIPPPFASVDDVLETIEFMYTEGNYSCDCNKALTLARSQQKEDPDVECGDTMQLRSLIAIAPNGEEHDLLKRAGNG